MQVISKGSPSFTSMSLLGAIVSSDKQTERKIGNFIHKTSADEIRELIQRLSYLRQLLSSREMKCLVNIVNLIFHHSIEV